MPCPWLADAIWDELPGGREARNPASGDTWRYVGFTVDDPHFHLFCHRSHPDYEGEPALATVVQREGVAELAQFSVLILGVADELWPEGGV